MLAKGTTPTHTFTLPFNTGIIKTVKVIYAQKNAVLFEKEGDACNCSDNTVTVKLTQEETLKFDCRHSVQIQMRILTDDDEALTSEIKYIKVGECLDGEVLV